MSNKENCLQYKDLDKLFHEIYCLPNNLSSSSLERLDKRSHQLLFLASELEKTSEQFPAIDTLGIYSLAMQYIAIDIKAISERLVHSIT